jgi:ATP-binding cassette subfamily B multidrug efflux pump
MFSRAERLIPTTPEPDGRPPPSGLLAFYWHFIRQSKGAFAALFAAAFVVALLDTPIPLFMGRVVALLVQATIANQVIAANVTNRIR